MSNWGFLEPHIRAWRKTWCSDLGSFKSRMFAYLDMLIIDHGLFRCFYANCFRVSDQVERRNHPTPLGVRRAAKRGVRTIVNLRGITGFGSEALSREACRRYGIPMVDFKLYSRKAPTRENIVEAAELFNTVEYPVMLHCKSGADRAGLMAVFYLLLKEGSSLEQARRQLHWKYGHIRLTKTGIMDYFLDTYEQAYLKTGIDFLTWAKTEYDSAALSKTFKVNRWGILLDKIMNRE